MFKTQPRTPRRNFGKPAASKGPRGTFQNNQWLCDCSPRIPAEHFQVKKEGKNKGRWFYTCQKHENERCGFFLWQEDAEPRMQGAVLGNSHTESVTAAKTGENGEGAGRSDLKKSRKRTLPWEQNDSPARTGADKQDSNVTDDSSFTPDANDNAAQMQSAEQVDRHHAMLPDTPRKAQKTSQFETPSSKTGSMANLSHGLTTPGTTPRNANTGRVVQQARADPETPTPLRTKDAMAGEEQLADKVPKLLELFDVTLNSSAAAALRGLLESEARKWQGVVKGRDAARAAVSARDARVAELLDTVSRLEGENEANKALISHLRGKG